MHFHNIFLVKAEDKTDAKRKVEEFLEDHPTEWDWYQFGGRWMWSDLIEKNIDKIVKPGTNYYWNKYHDEEVKGKKWKLRLPDGSAMFLDYGNDYPIKHWVHEHAELSEIIDATHPKFFEILNGCLDSYQAIYKRNVEDAERMIEFWKEAKDETMLALAQKRIDRIMNRSRWIVEAHFWNITSNDQSCNQQEIKKDPKHWFLVNVDLHS